MNTNNHKDQDPRGNEGFHTVNADRDPASKWAVDLNMLLEECLARICNGGGGDDSDGFHMNFAEAALLLQGSVQVYSRKVEYLYSLVLHALEFISQQRLQDEVVNTSIQPEESTQCTTPSEDNDPFWGFEDVPVEANNCLDSSNENDAPLNFFVKPPANLVVLEGDCLDTSGDAVELESYLLATTDLCRNFILLDPCDSVAVHEYLEEDTISKGNQGGYRDSSICKDFQSSIGCSGGAHKSSAVRSPVSTHISVSNKITDEEMKKALPSSLHSTSISTSSSSSSSIEAPKGCLKFFLSSKAYSKPTHKKKKKKTSCRIYQWSSSSSSAKPKSKLLSSHSVLKLNDCNTPNPPTDVHSSSTGAEKNNTPPIQPSLSPEIQQQPLLHKQNPLLFEHGSSTTTATTPSITMPCYAAGHVLSGVSDKRKCRPKGILSVIDDDCVMKGNAFDTINDNRIDSMTAINNILTVSTPREASVHWLLSPCKEEEERGNNYAGFRRLEEASLPLHFSSASPSSGPGFSLDASPTSTSTPIPTPTTIDTCNRDGRRRNPHLSSPPKAGELLQFQGVLEPLFDNNDVLSPIPTSRITDHFTLTPKGGSRRCNSVNDSLSIDSLSGGNVMRTPNSDSGSDRWVDFSLQSHTTKCKNDRVNSELNPNVGALDNKNISSENHFSTWDLTSSSFQFDSLDTPMDSIDLTLFQKVLDSEISWVSSSTVDNNISQSHLRISWRDGLASRIDDMDEYDSCRWLSEEEEDAVVCSPTLKLCPSPQQYTKMRNEKVFNNASDLMQLLDSKIQFDQLEKGNCPPKVPSLFVESMSLDGNALLASSDSGWNLCYKNKLFGHS